MAMLLPTEPVLAAGIFGMGLPELAVIGVIAVVIFGPKKLPELGSAVGKALRSFKQEMNNPGNDEQSSSGDEKSPKEGSQKVGEQKLVEKDAA